MMFRKLRVRCLFLPLLLLFLLGCSTPRFASNWSDLESGLTRSEVLELLGEPSSRVRLEQPGGRVARERWQYGDDSTSATSPTGLGIAPPADVFVVTFGADGKVASHRRPLVGPYAEPQNPDDPPDDPQSEPPN